MPIDPRLERVREAAPNTCALYAVRIRNRYTKAELCDLTEEPLTLSFSRGFNTTTKVDLVLAAADGCCICKPKAWRDELVIERQSEDGTHEGEVWVGPITRDVEDNVFGTYMIQASDRSVWWARRPYSRRLNLEGVELDEAVLWRLLVEDAEADDPSGLFIPQARPTGVTVEADVTTSATSSTASSDVRVGALIITLDGDTLKVTNTSNSPVSVTYGGDVRDGTTSIPADTTRSRSLTGEGNGYVEVNGTRVSTGRATGTGTEISGNIFGGLSSVYWTVVGNEIYGPGAETVPEAPTPYDTLDVSLHWDEGGAVIDTDGNYVTTQYTVVGTDIFGEAITSSFPPGLPTPDPEYGLHLLTVEDESLTTQAEVDAAARRLYDRDRDGQQFLVTSAGSLTADAPVTIWDLIPGRRFLVNADGACSSISEVQRLNNVVVEIAPRLTSLGQRLREVRVAIDLSPEGSDSVSADRISI